MLRIFAEFETNHGYVVGEASSLEEATALVVRDHQQALDYFQGLPQAQQSLGLQQRRYGVAMEAPDGRLTGVRWIPLPVEY